MKNALIYYNVGPLLYCPANHTGIGSSLINERFGYHFSLTFCLEDTIRDDRVEEAEEILLNTIYNLYQARETKDFFLPKIFVRVRNSEQMNNIYNRFGEAASFITGFNAPKFSPENADFYLDVLSKINCTSKNPVYLMPILENPDMINLQTRYDFLYTIKEKLDALEKYILNIRVGGNDLCHAFGFRRSINESIYDIHPISNLFSDIISVYGRDYVISGPVWEYYNGDGWDTGMRNELKLDKLSGFTGKTVIHPKQIPLVNDAYKVAQKDYDDAKSILNWNKDNKSLVSGSRASERMNEYKTHRNWAEKIMYLAETYGVC